MLQTTLMPDFQPTPLEIAVLRFDPTAAYGIAADHPAVAPAELPVLAYHLDLPGRSVLVDAPDYDEAGTPDVYRLPDYVAPPPLTEQLRRHGIEPDTITDVIVTHAHFDHFGGLTLDAGDGWVPAFPGARHWLGRAEWQPESFDALGLRTLAVIERAGLLHLNDGDVDLGDGLSLVAAPGESPGHMLARAELAGDVVYLAGDLYHHALEFSDPDLDVVWVDVAAMHASKRALAVRAQRERARVYFSHIRGAHRVIRDGSELRWVASSSASHLGTASLP